MKMPYKTQLNQITFHKLQLLLACLQTKICTLIRNTICESLVKIQQISNECSSIMYKNTQKNAIKSKALP